MITDELKHTILGELGLDDLELHPATMASEVPGWDSSPTFASCARSSAGSAFASPPWRSSGYATSEICRRSSIASERDDSRTPGSTVRRADLDALLVSRGRNRMSHHRRADFTIVVH
jgi:hypothetical protein